MTKYEAEDLQANSYRSKAYHSVQNAREWLRNTRKLPWIILVVAAINVIFIGGKRRAFGTFISQLHTDFNETSMTELNWIGDSYAALGFFLMPFCTSFLLQLNRPYRMAMLAAGILIFISCVTSAMVPTPSYLFLTHTLIHGIGSTLILCTTALITGQYFDKTHRFHVLATAFVSGGPYGILIFGPLFSSWIQNYGWRLAFDFCGVMFLLACLLAAVVFLPYQAPQYDMVIGENIPDPSEVHISDVVRANPSPPKLETGDGQDKKNGLKKLKPGNKNVPLYLQKLIKEPQNEKWAFCNMEHLMENKQIFLWAAERLLHNFVMYGLMMNLVTYAREHLNNQIMQAARISVFFGIGESAIFTFGALVGDKIRGYLPLTYLVGACFAALFLLIIQQTYTDITVLSVLSGFVGASIGVGNTFLYAASEEIMLIHGSVSFPVTKMIAGVGMILSPLLSGTIIDLFAFRGFFISMAILVCIRVVLLIGINILLWRKKLMVLAQISMNHEDIEDLNHCCEMTGRPCGQEQAQAKNNTEQYYENYNQQPYDQNAIWDNNAR
ncbi:hypothetical protein Ciccas_008104 [Cichlidogyrus casuarinus]|uniref:Major facilitator superfamily (MFS) profile domain-containing protein n=1 Tax=Cichlidogyrus casuarinus TaxID=1844966 RepID=A0ABD2Q0X2_9PLAT